MSLFQLPTTTTVTLTTTTTHRRLICALSLVYKRLSVYPAVVRVRVRSCPTYWLALPDSDAVLRSADALESNQINPFIRAQQAKWLEKGVPLICIFPCGTNSQY